MKSKLTLSIDSDILSQAKEFASKNNISLSSLVEKYFSSFKKGSKEYSTSLIDQIRVREPSLPYDDKSDDQWLEENLDI